jgi:hypothetical protein
VNGQGAANAERPCHRSFESENINTCEVKMTLQTFTKLYDSYEDANHTVRDLVQADIPLDDIGMIANDAEGHFGTAPPARASLEDTDIGEGAATGAKLGGVVGGGAALLAGLGALAIPGLGPVLAGGWLLATLVGAAAGAGVGAVSGGMISAVRAANVPEEHAGVYAECVRRGGALVTVRVDDARAGFIDAIMRRHSPVDPVARGSSYRLGGWTEFDANAPALAADELRRERMRFERDHAA